MSVIISPPPTHLIFSPSFHVTKVSRGFNTNSKLKLVSMVTANGFATSNINLQRSIEIIYIYILCGYKYKPKPTTSSKIS